MMLLLFVSLSLLSGAQLPDKPDFGSRPVLQHISAQQHAIEIIEVRTPIDPESAMLGTVAYGKAADRLSERLAAASRGEVEAMADVVEAYIFGLGTKPNAKLALPWLEKAAALGQPWAMSTLGEFYELGLNVPIDDAKALTLTKAAAEKQFPAALNNLGVRYFEAKGVERFTYVGLKLLVAAGEARSRAAVQNLILLFERSGLERDEPRFGNWLAVGIELQIPLAEYYKALSYEQGRHGFPKDQQTALTWYRIAANHGSASASFNLGNYYFGRNGNAPDYPEAKRWYELAASLGHPKGYYGLGEIYAAGLGVPQEPAKARVYFCAAALLGFVSKDNEDCPHGDTKQ